MKCPVCGSDNVTVQMVEKGQLTTKKGNGFGGHMNNMARATAAAFTLGASNLLWKKSYGTNKTSTQSMTCGICQDCGNTWEIKGRKGRKSAPGSIIR